MDVSPSLLVFIVVFCFATCEDLCIVTRIEHGDLLKEDMVSLTNSSGHVVGNERIYVKIDTAISESRESSLYVRCTYPYRFQGDPLRQGLFKISCSNGKWEQFPVCLLPPCGKRSLKYAGLDKSGEKTFFNGESFYPRCHFGYKVSEKNDRRIYCDAGTWTGNLPPCTLTQCRTESLSHFDGIILENNLTLNDGEWLRTRCDKGFEITDKNNPRIYCRGGKWEGSIPPCSPVSAQCRTESLSVFVGLLVENGLTLDDGEWLRPRCDTGFEIIDKNNPKIYCRGGKWEGNIPPCSPVQCRAESLSVYDGLILNSNFTLIDGQWFQPRCEEGYQISNAVETKLYCRKGQWVGNLPPCTAEQCSSETLSAYDGLILESNFTLLDGEWFQARCEEGFQFSDETKDKIYCRKGQWEGNLSPCTTVYCNTKSLSIYDGLILERNFTLLDGQSFQPRCDEGFQISNEMDFKIYCRKGQWEGNLPPCTAGLCAVPSVSNGQIGRYQTRFIRKKKRTYFSQLSEGTALLEDEIVILKCNDGYVPKSQRDQSILTLAVTCRKGMLLPEAECITLAEPCSTESLQRFPGLVLSGQQVLQDGDWIESVCTEGYEFPDKNATKLYCSKGSWEGNLPPCVPASCQHSPPVPENGRIKPILWTNGHGAVVEYECLPNFDMQRVGRVVCDYGKWTGLPPTCTDKRCYLSGLPKKEGIDLSSDEPVSNLRPAKIKCIEGYMLRYPAVFCVNGEWRAENDLSPCQESSCRTEAVHNGDVLKEVILRTSNIRDSPAEENSVYEHAEIGSLELSGTSLFVSCWNPYRFQGIGTEDLNRITCSKGKWSPFPTCELPSTCSMAYLYDLIPEDVTVLTDKESHDEVQNGEKLNLGCARLGRIFIGQSIATCNVNGEWIVDENIECTDRCELQIENLGPEVTASPMKRYYKLRESVEFSCPEELSLTQDVERIMCLNYGWEPNIIPDCQ